MNLPSAGHHLVLDPVRRTGLHHARGEGGRIETRRLGEGHLRLDRPGLTVDVAEVLAGL